MLPEKLEDEHVTNTEMAQSPSRLSRHQARESKRQLYIYILIIVVLIALMLTFGTRIIEFIGNATYLIRGDDETTTQTSIDIIQSPTMDELPEAVSSDKVVVAGQVLESGGVVEIFVNGEKVDTEKLDPEREFSFDITLEEGNNEIKTRYILNKEKSDFSDPQIVIYSKDKPKLEELSPSDGQEFKRGDERIEVRGKTDVDATVTINGFRAVVEQDGSFSYYLKLNSGDNTVTVIAKNKAGLEEKKEFRVKYSP